MAKLLFFFGSAVLKLITLLCSFYLLSYIRLVKNVSVYLTFSFFTFTTINFLTQTILRITSVSIYTNFYQQNKNKNLSKII